MRLYWHELARLRLCYTLGLTLALIATRIGSLSMESGGRNLVYEVLPQARLIISCQNKHFPTDTEWDSWISAGKDLELQTQDFRLLVVSEGGHPTKPQLDRLRAVNRSNPPTAIISASMAYRFMAAALTFINPKVRCYSPAEREKAFEHIGLSRADGERANAVIGNLRQQLAVHSSIAPTPW